MGRQLNGTYSVHAAGHSVHAVAGILSVREFGAVLSEDEIQYP